jgi:alkyl sulfatase BDS1-like metallo-beta-lactamase superfamily hydrolase
VIVLNWNFTDVGEQYVLNLENSALTYMRNRQAADADATITLKRATLDAVNMGKTTFAKAILAGNIKVVGKARKLAELMALMDRFDGRFNIITS